MARKKHVLRIEKDPRSEEMKKDISEGMSCSRFVSKYGISRQSYYNYKNRVTCEPIAHDFLSDGNALLRVLKEVAATSRLIYESYLQYLSDPENPAIIDPSPRASEIDVICARVNPKTGGIVRTRQSLQSLLDEMDEGGYKTSYVRVNTTDVRKLVIEQSNALTKQLELIARIQGQIKDCSISIFNNPAWVKVQNILLDATREYPEIKERIAERLSEIGRT